MFRFRLQRVLELRERREDDAATQLAEARAEAALALEAARALEAEQHTQLARAAEISAADGGVNAGQLQNLALLIAHLGERVDEAYRAVDSAELRVRERLQAFSEALRDRQVLDKLKERDLSAWRSDAVQADRNAMDSIALNQYVRAALRGVRTESER